jgi:hypothetical protein
MKGNQTMTKTIEQMLQRFIYCNVSGIVIPLANGYVERTSGPQIQLAHFVERSVWLASPIDDQREPREFWAVSPLLGELLVARGERVDFNFGGLVVWARMTDQLFYMDPVIKDIYDEIG